MLELNCHINDLRLSNIEVVQISDHYRNTALNDFNTQCQNLIEDGWVPISDMQYHREGSQHTFTQQFARTGRRTAEG